MQLKNFKCSSKQEISDNEIVGEVIGKYKDMTEDELLAELVKVAKSSKENGTFDENAIENFLQIGLCHCRHIITKKFKII